jgi:uncharacterized protein (TIGR02266 family)
LSERRELRRAAVSAARKAREQLATALDAMQAGLEVAHDVRPVAERCSRVVRVLYAVEADRDAESVVDTLRFAMERLQGLLIDLRRSRPGHPSFVVTSDCVAQTLAMLYPAHKELERALDPEHVDAIIPLARRRESEAANDDRRTAPRAGILADIGFHTESNFFTGFTGDISDGGIFVATYDVLPPGTDLDVSFVLPSGQHVTAHGRVTWVRQPGHGDDTEPGMGVAFARLSEEDRAAIVAFMNARAPLFYDT